MGFEIVLKFHEEISKGEYNKEELKTKTTKVGGPLEDVPIDVVAGKIIAQLARRNILVVDVEIYEITKKKVSFKETPDGILIKNKKFRFDDGALITTTVETEEEKPSQQLVPYTPPQTHTQNDVTQLLAVLLQQLNIKDAGALTELVANKGLVKPAVPKQKDKVLRQEIFDPMDKLFLDDAKRRKLAFTLGKKYPIIRERIHENPQVGVIYTTVDDNGNYQTLPDKFFSPEIKNLANDFEVENFKPLAVGNKSADGLSWDNVVGDDVGAKLR